MIALEQGATRSTTSETDRHHGKAACARGPPTRFESEILGALQRQAGMGPTATIKAYLIEAWRRFRETTRSFGALGSHGLLLSMRKS